MARTFEAYLDGKQNGLPPMRDLVLYIHDGSPIETVAAANARRDFGEFGYRVEELSVLDAGAHSKLEAMLTTRRDELFCFYSSNFWALNIRSGDRLLHTFTGIPLVILMEDHPVYFLQYVSSALDGAIIFLPGEDLAAFVAAHYRCSVETVTNPGYLPHDPSSAGADFAEFTARENRVLCPMNLWVAGKNLDQTWAVIKRLPQERSLRARRLIDAALTDCDTPLYDISRRMAAGGDPELAIEDMRLVLDFVKIWRRTRVFEMLADLPVLFSSAYVPADLERRYPEKFTLLTRTQTVPLYREYRFVVNVNPLLTHCIHERVSDALVHGCIPVTDPNAILRRYFEDGRDAVFIDFEKGDLAQRVATLLDDPVKAFEMVKAGRGIAARQAATRDAFSALIETVRRKWES